MGSLGVAYGLNLAPVTGIIKARRIGDSED